MLEIQSKVRHLVDYYLYIDTYRYHSKFPKINNLRIELPFIDIINEIELPPTKWQKIKNSLFEFTIRSLFNFVDKVLLFLCRS